MLTIQTAYATLTCIVLAYITLYVLLFLSFNTGLRYYTLLTMQTVCAILTYYGYSYIHYFVHGNKLCLT